MPITAKARINKILQNQPDDSSYEELVRELAFEAMIDRGIRDMKKGRLISDRSMGRRIRAWQK